MEKGSPEYRKCRDLFFSTRNGLDQVMHWYEYRRVRPVEHLPECSERNVMTVAHQLKRGQNPTIPLWVCSNSILDATFNYDTFKRIAHGIRANQFDIITADTIVTRDVLHWQPERLQQDFHRKLVFIPQDRTQFPHDGYIRHHRSADPCEDPEYVRDLKELDAYFGNT